MISARSSCAHDQRQVFLRLHHQVEPLAHAGGALLGGAFTPFRESRPGGFDRAPGFGGAALRDLGDDFAGGGVGYRYGFAAVRVLPLPVDIGLCLE